MKSLQRNKLKAHANLPSALSGVLIYVLFVFESTVLRALDYTNTTGLCIQLLFLKAMRAVFVTGMLSASRVLMCSWVASSFLPGSKWVK